MRIAGNTKCLPNFTIKKLSSGNSTLSPVTDFSDYTESTLKAETSTGNERAFRELFDRYQDRLYQYIFRMVKSAEVAEELVMDVFLKLWQGRDMLPEIQNLNGFLFKVAFTKTMDFFRSAARNKKFVDLLSDRIVLASSTDIHGDMILKEYEAQLRQAISLLPPRRKLIFELNREGNLSHDEIARQLDISKSTVANSIVEARQFIKEYLLKNIDVLSVATIIYILKMQ